MDYIIAFEYETIIDNKIFFDYIWKEFYKKVFVKRYEYILMDFSRVSKIKPEVLPKLCCFGQIAHDNGSEIEINVNPVSELKDYLVEIGFFTIVQKEKIFRINEGQIGGEYKKGKATKAFLGISDTYLKNKYLHRYEFNCNEAEVIKYCIKGELYGESYFPYENISEQMIKGSKILSVLENVCRNKNGKIEMLNRLVDDFVELIHNAVWHGKKTAFFSVQAANYNPKYEKKFSRVDVCISDSGEGLYNSLFKKNWKDECKTTKTMPLDQFLALSSEKKKNLYAIMEMILYRLDDNERGIYDIMLNLIDKKNLNIDIVNGNMHLFLNKKYYNSREALKKLLQGRLEDKVIVEEKKSLGYGFSMDISFEIE